MTIAPLQSWGIGDILFTIPIFRDYIKQGHHILWGVEPHFLSLQKHFPDIEFIDKKDTGLDYNRMDEYEINGMKVIPLRWATNILGLPAKDFMRAKYLYFKKDIKQWRTLWWERDEIAENTLFYDVLQLGDGEKYRLINRTFRHDNSGKCQIQEPNGMTNVEMRPIEGFSLLDWCKVIENADDIHTVSTSIFYLLELLTLKCVPHLYVRKPDEKDFSHVDFLMTKTYNLHL